MKDLQNLHQIKPVRLDLFKALQISDCDGLEISGAVRFSDSFNPKLQFLFLKNTFF